MIDRMICSTSGRVVQVIHARKPAGGPAAAHGNVLVQCKWQLKEYTMFQAGSFTF